MCPKAESKRWTQRGMTLIEVMVALGVMVILVGGIFLVVQTSMHTVLLIDRSSSRQDELSNTIDILRAAFLDLPSVTRLAAEPVRIGGADGYLLVLRDAPDVLTWLPGGESLNMVVLLGAWPLEDGWKLGLKRFLPDARLPVPEMRPEALLQVAAEIPWLPLVGGFRQVEFRFYDAKTTTWSTTWDRPEVRPSLIELHLLAQETEATGGERPVFWLPPVRVVTAEGRAP